MTRLAHIESLRQPPFGERPLGRQAALYAIGAFVGKGFGFLMLPLLASALTPSELGRVDVLSTLGSNLVTILLLGVDVAFVREYVRRGDDRGSLTGTWIAIGAATVAAPAVALVVAADGISQALFGTTSVAGGVSLVALTLVIGTLHVVNLNVSRASQHAGRHAALNVLALGMYAVLAAAFLWLGSRSAMSVIAAWASALGVAAVVGLWLNRGEITPRPSARQAARLLRVGLPLAPAVAIVWVSDFAVRAVLVTTSGSDAAGFLSVAVRVASVASLVLYAFQFAWQPVALASREGDATRRRAEVRGFVTASSVLLAAVALAAPEVVSVLADERFTPAIPVVAAVALGVVFQAISLVNGTYLLWQGRSGALALSTSLGAIAGFLVTVGLAPAWGAVGAALGITIGQAVTAMVGLLSGAGTTPAWIDRRVVVPVAIATVVLLAMVIRPDLSAPARLGVALACVLVIGTVGTWRDMVELVRMR